VNQSNRYLPSFEVLLIIGLASVPLMVNFPYRVNIFLSWEGAYRISQGQLPFRDFGIPLGGVYWLIPALFFKIFGPQLITLIKAQVFINIIAGLSFRSILSSLSIRQGIRFTSVLLFCLSYSFFNFWPWYNHSVIVYELIGLAFLLKYFFRPVSKYGLVLLLAAGFFICCSFLTKQDGGGMALLICCGLLSYYCGVERKWMPLVWFLLSFFVFFWLILIPVPKEGFSYWFNHGQPPHSSRVSVFDLVEEFLSASQWIKFYLFLIILLFIPAFKNWRDALMDKKAMVFLLLVLCILGEALVFQVTSYTPPDNNIFFHSFAIAFILARIAELWPINTESPRTIVFCSLGILLWWSGTYWKYIERFTEKTFPRHDETRSPTGENIVNKKTYMINRDSSIIPMSQWVPVGLPVFDKILMPQSTVDGIHRLLNMDLVKKHIGLKVLNMTELTPLAIEVPYALQRDRQLPLWYHLGVGMFNQQAGLLENKIVRHEYDLVLFEYMPNLNNFYPFRVRDSLMNHYLKVDSFLAPRRDDPSSLIEVYVKP
jgi:hypothetical protein